MASMKPDPRTLLTEFIADLNAGDWTHAREKLADDYTEDWPQTGERVTGVENLQAILANYPDSLSPGAIDATRATVVGSEDRYVVTPSMTVVRVEGEGEFYTMTYTARYPDESTWFVVMVARVADGRIRRAHTYFAPMLPTPDWRRQWTEPLADGAGMREGQRGT
jgi:SnoaL-like domain